MPNPAESRLENLRRLRLAYYAADEELERHVRAHPAPSYKLPPPLREQRLTLIRAAEGAHSSYAETLYGTA